MVSDGFAGSDGEYCIQFTQLGGATNDECADAIDLSGLLGGDPNTPVSSDLFTNNGATSSMDDPSTGWDCWGEPDGSGTAPSLDNSVWFTFTGACLLRLSERLIRLVI